ncbi:MAG: adenylate/guanylate cyclase domain-containing protein, partial [Betaproteobacteria bacterium]
PGLPLMKSYVPNFGSLDFSTLHLGLLIGLMYCLIGLVMAFAVTVRNKEIKDAFDEQVRTRQAFMEEQNQVLEQRVKERTHELMLQTEKTERLMLNILPAPIAERLKRGEPGISDSHASVSILFSDLVGFTALSSKRSADEVVKLLNDLFSRFDIRAKSLGLEKIKTIGDAYMVAGGIPQADDRHAELVTTMALGMREDLRTFNEENGTDIAMRIGINSGSVIAGVIGHTKFSYDLWGNTVNAASRMESTCEVGQIQVSASTFELIKDLFSTRERGFVECKGLGQVKTFFVDQALGLL